MLGAEGLLEPGDCLLLQVDGLAVLTLSAQHAREVVHGTTRVGMTFPQGSFPHDDSLLQQASRARQIALRVEHDPQVI